MRGAEIGIFGGSGFYSWLSETTQVQMHTPYGAPSGPITLGEVGGRPVAFLPRHGPAHELPAHSINYRANVWAFKELGVSRIVAPNAAGSLQPHVHPGDVVVCDQLFDRTSGRAHTFYDGPLSVHVSWADPYCPELRPVASQAARTAGMRVHDAGTVVVIQGPRFSTRAESAWYRSQGWEVVNMTQYPEAYLAREAEMCYVGMSLITDYDVGVDDAPGSRPVTMDEVFRVFAANLDTLRTALFTLIPAIPAERRCDCGRALDGTPVRG